MRERRSDTQGEPLGRVYQGRTPATAMRQALTSCEPNAAAGAERADSSVGLGRSLSRQQTLLLTRGEATDVTPLASKVLKVKRETLPAQFRCKGENPKQRVIGALLPRKALIQNWSTRCLLKRALNSGSLAETTAHPHRASAISVADAAFGQCLLRIALLKRAP
jgi:hypothetical protein